MNVVFGNPELGLHSLSSSQEETAKTSNYFMFPKQKVLKLG